MCIFDLHTSKTRYELKVILLHLCNIQTIFGFINILEGKYNSRK
jgi:hypothetical protein